MQTVGGSPGAIGRSHKTRLILLSANKERLINRQHKVVFALSIVFVAGLVFGRLSAPETATSPARAVPLAAGPEPAPAAPQRAALTARVAGSSISDPARDPVWADALSLDPHGVLEQSDFDWRGEPQEAADFVISQMSDDELISLISGVTNLTDEELSSVRDLREFASRLSSVALGSELDEPAASALAAQPEPVSFSTRVGPDNGADGASEAFAAGEHRIYAVFPSDRYRQDTVLVKWSRLDDPKVLMFRKHAIVADDAQSFVWFAPTGGWASGDYGVEFYTNDTRVERIASGHYTVR